MEDKIQIKERSLIALIKEGRKAEALSLLYELVAHYALLKQFARAESLRLTMIKLDASAISFIASAGEIIEAEKDKLISLDHKMLWKKFYASLTPGERSAFFFACEERNFSSAYFFFRQKEKNDKLFFIDRGFLGLSFSDELGEEKILDKIGPGELIGYDTFFGISFCTFSLVGLSKGSCRILGLEALKALKSDFPNLDSKIYNYCLSQGSLKEALELRNFSRRRYKRIAFSGAIVFQFLSAKSLGFFKGSLIDISLGGLAFYLTYSAFDGFSSFLGQNIAMKFLLALEKVETIVCRGTIVAVDLSASHEYVVRVSFDQPLSFLKDFA